MSWMVLRRLARNRRLRAKSVRTMLMGARLYTAGAVHGRHRMHRLLVPFLLMMALAPMPSTAMPQAPAWLAGLDALYDAKIRVEGLEDRRFQPEQWWNVAAPLANAADGFAVEEIGRSVEGR